MPLTFDLKNADVLDVPADVLVLKYARGAFGADRYVAERLVRLGLCAPEEIQPAPDEAALVQTHGVLKPARVLFLGTLDLRELDVASFHQFARRAVRAIHERRLPASRVTTTVHGTRFGLDPGDSLRAIVAGFRREGGETRADLGTVTFVDKNPQVVAALQSVLAELNSPAGRDVPAK